MIPLFFLAMAASEPPAAAEETPAEMDKILQDCDAHKFETTVMAVVDGKPHQSKVKLCGTSGQSDAAWIDTLKDAMAKVKANQKMPQELRDQIASALDLELARLGHGDAMSLIANSAPSIAKRPPAPAPGIAALAPRATADVSSASSRPLAQDYGSLPPLPTPKPAVAASAAVSALLPSLPAPRMTIRCGSTENPNALDPCSTLRTDTVLLVEADEQMPAGTSLRFVRRDDPRAEISLAGLRSGQTARILLPSKVCDGVVRSEVNIEVLRKPANAAEQVVDTRGPYDLHC